MNGLVFSRCSLVIFAQITFNNKAHSGRIKIDMEHDASISECRDWEIIGACECFPKRSNGGDLKARSFSFVRSFSRSGALPDWDVWLSHHCDLHQLLHPLHALRHHRDSPAVCKRKVTQRKSTSVAAPNSWCPGAVSRSTPSTAGVAAVKMPPGQTSWSLWTAGTSSSSSATRWASLAPSLK